MLYSIKSIQPSNNNHDIISLEYSGGITGRRSHQLSTFHDPGKGMNYAKPIIYLPLILAFIDCLRVPAASYVDACSISDTCIANLHVNTACLCAGRDSGPTSENSDYD